MMAILAELDATILVRTNRSVCIYGDLQTNLFPVVNLHGKSFVTAAQRESSLLCGKRGRMISKREELGDHQVIGDAARNAHNQDLNERQVRDLERINEKLAVQKSPKMKKKHRLKLDTTSTSSERRKRKRKPSFDIHFTGVEAHSNANKIIDVTLDNGDLPNIEQLLSGYNM
jgi:hypothetical protein